MKTTKLMHQSNKSLTFLLLVLLISLAFVGCSEEEVELGPNNETFAGTYMARDLSLTEMSGKKDSINISIDNGSTYSLEFYQSSSSSIVVNFCDHNGNISGFGTGPVRFAPTSISYGNCDTLRIPRGTFTADFVNYGDTIYLTKRVTKTNNSNPNVIDTISDSLYIFKLLK